MKIFTDSDIFISFVYFDVLNKCFLLPNVMWHAIKCCSRRSKMNGHTHGECVRFLWSALMEYQLYVNVCVYVYVYVYAVNDIFKFRPYRYLISRISLTQENIHLSVSTFFNRMINAERFGYLLGCLSVYPLYCLFPCWFHFIFHKTHVRIWRLMCLECTIYTRMHFLWFGCWIGYTSSQFIISRTRIALFFASDSSNQHFHEQFLNQFAYEKGLKNIGPTQVRLDFWWNLPEVACKIYFRSIYSIKMIRLRSFLLSRCQKGSTSDYFLRN